MILKVFSWFWSSILPRLLGARPLQASRTDGIGRNVCLAKRNHRKKSRSKKNDRKKKIQTHFFEKSTNLFPIQFIYITNYWNITIKNYCNILITGCIKKRVTLLLLSSWKKPWRQTAYCVEKKYLCARPYGRVFLCLFNRYVFNIRFLKRIR